MSLETLDSAHLPHRLYRAFTLIHWVEAPPLHSCSLSHPITSTAQKPTLRIASWGRHCTLGLAPSLQQPARAPHQAAPGPLSHLPRSLFPSFRPSPGGSRAKTVDGSEQKATTSWRARLVSSWCAGLRAGLRGQAGGEAARHLLKHFLGVLGGARSEAEAAGWLALPRRSSQHSRQHSRQVGVDRCGWVWTGVET
jgi:hypothetical protein